MGKLAGTFTADKDYKAGEVISAEFEYADTAFNDKVRDRLRREEEKLSVEKKRAEDAETELKKLKDEAQASAKPDEKQAALIKEQGEQLAKLQSELDEKNHRERIHNAIEKQAKDLPQIFRNQIRLAKDVSDDDISDAIKAQQESYTTFLKDHKVSPSGDEQPSGNYGGGSGPAQDKPANAGDTQALDRLRRASKLFETVRHYPEADQVNAAKGWIEDGTMAKAEAAQKAE